jgi:hypothetical protein
MVGGTPRANPPAVHDDVAAYLQKSSDRVAMTLACFVATKEAVQAQSCSAIRWETRGRERGQAGQQHGDVEGSHRLIRVADEALIFGESGGFPSHKKSVATKEIRNSQSPIRALMLERNLLDKA